MYGRKPYKSRPGLFTLERRPMGKCAGSTSRRGSPTVDPSACALAGRNVSFEEPVSYDAFLKSSCSNPSSRMRHGIAFGCVWRCTARNSNARTRTCESTSVRIMRARLARGEVAASRLALHPGNGQLVVPGPQRESLLRTPALPELLVRVTCDDRTGRSLSSAGDDVIGLWSSHPGSGCVTDRVVRWA